MEKLAKIKAKFQNIHFHLFRAKGLYIKYVGGGAGVLWEP